MVTKVWKKWVPNWQARGYRVIISSDLKPSTHCKEVVKTANKIVGFIGRTFEYKSEKVICTLYL